MRLSCKTIVLFSVFWALVGCASSSKTPAVVVTPTPPRPEPPAPVQVGENAKLEVLFATDRAIKDSANFGVERGTLSFGVCRVNIPKIHKIGAVEAPGAWTLWNRSNPDEYILVEETATAQNNAFFGQIKSRLDLTRERSALVYVHGYNVDFEEAATRAAQLAFDLKFDGVSMFYSWPSQGEYSSYPVDETNVRWTQSHLEIFLEKLVREAGAKSIVLLAHSMGNRALMRVLMTLKQNNNGRVLNAIRNVVMVAPDVDADVFKREIGAIAEKSASRFTLYVSSEDNALKASKSFHGYPRAGEKVLLIDGVETIDATPISEGFLGHNYFAESRAIIEDIFALLKYGKPADERFGLRAVDSPEGRFWKVRR